MTESVFGRHDYILTSLSNDGDIKAAKDVAAALSAYRLPKGISADLPGYTDFAEDFDELPVTDAAVKQRLDSCRAMILICSPGTKDNPAILERLKYFEKSGRRDAIIPVLASGESRKAIPDFFYTTRIIERILKDGSIEKVTDVLSPIASDLRGAGTSEYKNMLAYETVRIVAALTGLHPDELEKRHERRRRQRFATLALGIGSVSVICAVIFLYLGFTAYNEGAIAELQTAASANTVERIVTDLPQQAAAISGADLVVDEAILDSLDALVANGSANLEAVDTDSILKIKEGDAALAVLKKASILRRLGESAAEEAYEAALERSSLLLNNKTRYENAYRYAIAAGAGGAGCIVFVIDYDSDVSPIARGEIITALNAEPFAKYRDYSAAFSELIPGSVSEASLVTFGEEGPTLRVQKVTTEQLKLLQYVIL
ncbi:MAG: hypothetical protein LBN12_00555 [Clostridiales Family XIII bacterium]|jgi:hypothetical protein|nr:hypothetical protein [Clostridiales Family XIII bacterium]